MFKCQWSFKSELKVKEQKALFSILFCIIFSTQIFGQTEVLKTDNQGELKIILKKCAEYCEKLSNSILDFICNEKIEEEINPQRSVYAYTYDYQVIRKDNVISNRRILLKENGKKKNEVDAQLKTRRYKHHNIIFGPIALLAEIWQPYYDYKIIQRKKFKGDMVIVVEATPNDKMTTSNPYGKVWVREGDFSIVKIEWDQKSLPNLDVFEKDAKIFRAKPEIIFNVEYGFEKNGIRFPNKYSVVETYYREGIKNFIRSRLFVTYKKYKFFTVESAVKY